MGAAGKVKRGKIGGSNEVKAEEGERGPEDGGGPSSPPEQSREYKN